MCAFLNYFTRKYRLVPGTCFTTLEEFLNDIENPPVYVFQDLDYNNATRNGIKMIVAKFGTLKDFKKMKDYGIYPYNVPVVFDLIELTVQINSIIIYGNIDSSLYEKEVKRREAMNIYGDNYYNNEVLPELLIIDDLINKISDVVNSFDGIVIKSTCKDKRLTPFGVIMETPIWVSKYEKISKKIKERHKKNESDEKWMHEFLSRKFDYYNPVDEKEKEEKTVWPKNRVYYWGWRSAMINAVVDSIMSDTREVRDFVKAYQDLSLKEVAELYEISVEDVKMLISIIKERYKIRR